MLTPIATQQEPRICESVPKRRWASSNRLRRGRSDFWPAQCLAAGVSYQRKFRSFNVRAGTAAGQGGGRASLKQLADSWVKSRPSFDDLLKHELGSYGSAMRQALSDQISRTQAAMSSDDPKSVLEMRFGLISRYQRLAILFERNGVHQQDAFKEVLRFLDWPKNQRQPAHKIFAYLFAALGWQISSSQRPEMNASILNDFTAIATYAPYVDAMFVDRQCASLLKQGRLRSELSFKARIFSLSAPMEFLDYLKNLSDSAPPEVCELAQSLYRVES